MAIEATLVLLMLLGASWSDLQTRRVSNLFWIPYIVVAAILWIERLLGGIDFVMIGIALIMTAAAYGLWWFGTFGGADAKGLMVFAWLWPGTPDLFAGHTIPVLDTLIHAAFLMLALPAIFLVWNAIRGDLAFPAMFLGVKMDTHRAAKQHVWPMQTMQDGRLRFTYWHRPATDLASTFAALRLAQITRVWTTPKVPFIVPLAAATFITAQWGNLLLALLLR